MRMFVRTMHVMRMYVMRMHVRTMVMMVQSTVLMPDMTIAMLTM